MSDDSLVAKVKAKVKPRAKKKPAVKKALADIPTAVAGEFSWALQRLQEGKVVARANWKDGSTISFNKHEYVRTSPSRGVEAGWTPSTSEMLAINWYVI